MSSMTLKEFMTRGNEGMEKRGASYYLDPDWEERGKDGPIRIRKQIQQQDPKDIGSFLPLQAGVTGLSNLPADRNSEEYRQQFDAFKSSNPKFFAIIEGFNRQFAPRILSGDQKAVDHLRAIGKQLPVASKFVDQYISNLEAAREKWGWLFKDNPKMAEALALKSVNEETLKNLGVDPKMARELMPGMKNYDMWQHTPGMALAFGLPFGIGAITGHPGWGALLGLLGAGGYGYYQYNKMQQALLNGTGNGTEKPEEVPASTSDPAEKVSGEPETNTRSLPGPSELDDSSTGNIADGEKRTINPKIQSGEKRLSPNFLGPHGLSPAFNKKETVNRPEYLGPHRKVSGPFVKKVEVPVQSTTQTSPSN